MRAGAAIAYAGNSESRCRSAIRIDGRVAILCSGPKCCWRLPFRRRIVFAGFGGRRLFERFQA